MASIQVINIMKVIDIDKMDIDNSTWEFLNMFHVTYKDQILREHIINIGDALEDLGNIASENAKIVKKEIRQLAKLADKNDSAYIKFVEH